jgi:hypothetical protein
MKACVCGSYAINKHRQAEDSDLSQCDPCFWATKYMRASEQLEFCKSEILRLQTKTGCTREQHVTSFCSEAVEQLKKIDAMYSDHLAIKSELMQAVSLLYDAELSGPAYVDITKRSIWKSKREILIKKYITDNNYERSTEQKYVN